MSDIAGTANFTVDGQQLALVGEFIYQINGYSREELVGMDGFHGNKRKVKVGSLKFKIRNLGNLSLAQVAGWVNVTAQSELANGKTVIGSGMFLTEPPTADAEEAEIEGELRGPSVVEA